MKRPLKQSGLPLGLAVLASPLVGAAMPLPQIQSHPQSAMQAPAHVGLPAPASILVEIDGLRSNHGRVLACMTANPKAFPDCQKDPDARHLTVPAINGETVQFKDVPQGRYAIALFHDENGNGRMDKVMMIPREGFGFSRDAPLQFGPPKFGAAAFQVGAVQFRTAIKVRYIL